MKLMNKIAIFASGSGTNAENIVKYFQNTPIEIVLILTNKEHAGVIERSKKLNIPCHYFSTEEMKQGIKPLKLLLEKEVDVIVLAGYLCLITPPYLDAFPKRIINIHPALLPSYGGKGMYGDHVHEAVINAGEKLSGITIHLVDEVYDHGRTLCQATCPVLPSDDTHSLSQRIHILEYRYFPVTIEQYLEELRNR